MSTPSAKPLPVAQITYAELLSLRADKARLDWLEQHSYRTIPQNPPPVYVIAHSSVWPAAMPNQLRHAIDLTMVVADKAIEFPEPGSKAWIDREVERAIEKD